MTLTFSSNRLFDVGRYAMGPPYNQKYALDLAALCQELVYTTQFHQREHAQIVTFLSEDDRCHHAPFLFSFCSAFIRNAAKVLLPATLAVVCGDPSICVSRMPLITFDDAPQNQPFSEHFLFCFLRPCIEGFQIKYGRAATRKN